MFVLQEFMENYVAQGKTFAVKCSKIIMKYNTFIFTNCDKIVFVLENSVR